MIECSPFIKIKQALVAVICAHKVTVGEASHVQKYALVWLIRAGANVCLLFSPRSQIHQVLHYLSRFIGECVRFAHFHDNECTMTV